MAENFELTWSFEMENNQNAGRMLDIWFFSGLILVCYGLILMGVGIYYLYYPYHNTILSELHPNLWWGGIMFLSGLSLQWLSWRGRHNL